MRRTWFIVSPYRLLGSFSTEPRGSAIPAATACSGRGSESGSLNRHNPSCPLHQEVAVFVRGRHLLGLQQDRRRRQLDDRRPGTLGAGAEAGALIDGDLRVMALAEEDRA